MPKYSLEIIKLDHYLRMQLMQRRVLPVQKDSKWSNLALLTPVSPSLLFLSCINNAKVAN